MNKLNNALFVVIGVALDLALLSTSTPADAAVRFCFKHNVDFIDSGQELQPGPACNTFSPGRCEDQWQTNSAYAVRGMRVKVEKLDGSAYVSVWGCSSGWYTDDGNGSDGAGCTPPPVSVMLAHRAAAGERVGPRRLCACPGGTWWRRGRDARWV